MYQRAEHQSYWSRFVTVSNKLAYSLCSYWHDKQLFPPVLLECSVICSIVQGVHCLEAVFRSLPFLWYVVHNQIQTLLVPLELFNLAIMRFTCPLQSDQSLFVLSSFAVCIIRCPLCSSAVCQALRQVISWFIRGSWGKVFWLTTRGCGGRFAAHGKRYWSIRALIKRCMKYT